MPRDLINLLVLEDDEQDLVRLGMNIEQYNNDEKNPCIFRVLESRTRSDAVKLLSNNDIDCAMLDLRVPDTAGGASDERLGNAAIEDVLSNYAIPIVIHSGHLRELREDFRNSPIKQIVKEAGSYQEAFAWLSTHIPLMQAVKETNHRIRRQTARVFFRGIWPSWEAGLGTDLEGKAIYDVICRQIVSYIAEQLSLPNSEVGNHNLREFYFRPPLRDRLHTGDLLRFGDNFHVIITPQCNIANGYPDHFLLARCDEIKKEYGALKERIEKNGGTPSNSVTDKIKSWATQKFEIRQHFLPPCGERGPWLVDFAQVVSKPKSESERLLKCRFASITPQFIPNLVQRWSSYIGRVGQPDLDIESLIVDIVNFK